MRRAVSAFSAFLIWIVVLTMVAPGAARAAGGAAVTIGESGATVTVSDPWSIQPVAEAGDGSGVVVLTGTNDTLVMGSMPTGDSVTPAADILAAAGIALPDMQDIQVNDQWVFQWAEVDGVPYGLFGLILPRDPSVQIYISPVSTFGAGVEALQAAVKVDGAPVFAGVDGVSLQAALSARAGKGDARADASLAPLTAAAVASRAVTATDPVKDQSVTAGPAWTGHWTSPRYGLEFRWTSEWRAGDLPEGYAPARPDTAADAGTPDQLILERVDGSGITLIVYAWPSNGESPEQWFASWSMQNATYGMPVCLLDGDSPEPRVVGTVVRYIDGSRVGDMDVREARLAYGDMAHLVVSLVLPSGATGEDFRTATAGITIDGGPPFLLVRPYNVEAAVPGLSPSKGAGNTVDGR